ncbi:hypothetical protein MCCG_0976 [Mycoplasma capricolum subsp. capripneumoniae 87001]|uniref:Uncharacterized protein n=2 Tax=Mycoplasma capricolum TaxID=2095 RepID=A0A9N7BQL1_MYCCC|nr:hypothetical protein [Mycoplasma capricolum]AJK51891.1 hypothetical protein MCCG_0976 [Mycoplasma capricolum subsp. capripneumoniae 87001]WGD33471.1 hypothetical protein Mccp14020TZ_10130 [Mycoplasma capricolum subsp. capripneumoniae]CEA11346.1 hypothetical protein MCCPILRI181_01008 [Mycoplasma capricolum subsp. capripneumoniae]CEA12346.1 hypothetical protein MCCPF38_01010 [Mycoplasma capricolum subsp. capripneumoniae]
MKSNLTKEELEKEIDQKQKEIEQLKENYNSLLASQTEFDQLVKEYESERKKIRSELAKKIIISSSIEDEIESVNKKNKEIESQIKTVLKKKHTLKQEAEAIYNTIDEIRNKKPYNIDQKTKDSISKIGDIIETMKTWNSESLLHIKPRITDQIRKNDLPLLGDHFEQVKKELEVLKEFSDILENFIKKFNQKYNDKFLEINEE